MDIEQTLWALVFLGGGAALGLVTLHFVAAALSLLADWLERQIP